MAPWFRPTRTRNPKRLLVLNWRDPWHPEGGGSELYVQQVCRRIAASGVPVTVFAAAYPGAASREVRDGITYVRRGGHITVYLWSAWFMVSRRFGRVDRVLEVQNGMPFLARLFTRRPVVVLVHHVHREQWPIVTPVLARLGWFMESRVAVRVNHRRSRYVAVSAATRDELVTLGVDPRTMALAYNGMPPMPSFPRRSRAADPRLAVLSRLVPHKRIEHAIEAIAALRTEFPGIGLDVMGSGWWQDQLVAFAHGHGVADRVVFHGHVTDQQKFEILSRAWVHVLPSIKEGWGLAIIEAASVGVPSVAYWAAGGVRESVQDGVTGLLAHSQDDLVAATRRLLTDEALRLSLGEKAEVRTAGLTWEATTATIRQALEL